MPKKYIDAELAEAAMTKLYEEDIEMYAVEIPETFDKGRAILELQKIPAADVKEVKHGHWIKQHVSQELCGVEYYHCSLCDHGEQYKSPYCPFCGARMDEKEK